MRHSPANVKMLHFKKKWLHQDREERAAAAAGAATSTSQYSDPGFSCGHIRGHLPSVALRDVPLFPNFPIASGMKVTLGTGPTDLCSLPPATHHVGLSIPQFAKYGYAPLPPLHFQLSAGSSVVSNTSDPSYLWRLNTDCAASGFDRQNVAAAADEFQKLRQRQHQPPPSLQRQHEEPEEVKAHQAHLQQQYQQDEDEDQAEERSCRFMIDINKPPPSPCHSVDLEIFPPTPCSASAKAAPAAASASPSPESGDGCPSSPWGASEVKSEASSMKSKEFMLKTEQSTMKKMVERRSAEETVGACPAALRLPVLERVADSSSEGTGSAHGTPEQQRLAMPRVGSRKSQSPDLSQRSMSTLVSLRRRRSHGGMGEQLGAAHRHAEAKRMLRMEEQVLGNCLQKQHDQQEEEDEEDEEGDEGDPGGCDGMQLRGSSDESAEEQREGHSGTPKACLHCGTTRTPLWRNGPPGPKSLCNACGIRFNKIRSGKRKASPKEASMLLKYERSNSSTSSGVTDVLAARVHKHKKPVEEQEGFKMPQQQPVRDLPVATLHRSRSKLHRQSPAGASLKRSHRDEGEEGEEDTEGKAMRMAFHVSKRQKQDSCRGGPQLSPRLGVHVTVARSDEDDVSSSEHESCLSEPPPSPDSPQGSPLHWGHSIRANGRETKEGAWNLPEAGRGPGGESYSMQSWSWDRQGDGEDSLDEDVQTGARLLMEISKST